VNVSFFEMPPNNKGKNMSNDMPSKYTKRTPLFASIRCLPNIIKNIMSVLQIMVLKANGLHVNIY
jgi:hypothetical protein